MSQEALTSSTKDFEIACWLSEALVRLHGLEGLTASALLIRGLCEQYWETGFPSPDEDGSLEARAIPIGGLSGEGGDGTLVRPLRACTLFYRSDRSPASYALWDLAKFTNALPEERRTARLAAGAPSLEALKAEARGDLGTLSATAEAASAALEAWQAMDAALTERFGADAPSMRKVTTLLEEIVGIAESMGVSPSPDGEAPEPDEPAGASVTGAAPARADATAAVPAASLRASADALRSREDALRELDRIAAFFRQTEPHSPLSYTLQEAVRRGRMSFNELLAEVLPNEEARKDMLARLGLRVETEPEQ